MSAVGKIASLPASVALEALHPGEPARCAPPLSPDRARMQLDHLAYLVRDTDQALSALRPLSPRILVDRHPLPSQGAFITMVELAGGGPKTELVEPFTDNQTMQARLDREGVNSLLYHSGFVVEGFDAQFRAMRGGGWLPLTLPFEGLSPGCRASHLYHPDFGIVEIMEAAP